MRSGSMFSRTPILRAFLTSSTTGTPIVPAQAGRIIRVLSASTVVDLAVSVSFGSNVTAITSAKPLAANGGFVLPFEERGWFETNVGEALTLILSSPVTTAIDITYEVE